MRDAQLKGLLRGFEVRFRSSYFKKHILNRYTTEKLHLTLFQNLQKIQIKNEKKHAIR